MSTITTRDGTEIFFKDWGDGQPMVFSRSWPLSADDWDTQMLSGENGVSVQYELCAREAAKVLQPQPDNPHPSALTC